MKRFAKIISGLAQSFWLGNAPRMIPLNMCMLGRHLSKLITALALFLLAANTAVNAKDVQANPEAALLNRAKNFEHSGKLEEANALYTQVLSIDGKSSAAFAHRGDNFLVLGHYRKALDDANAWVAVSPERNAYMFRAEVLMKLGQAEAALTDLDRCITPKGFPDLIESTVAVRRAVARMLCGHFRDARADAYTQLTMVPRSVLSLELCSVADALCGRESDAVSSLAQFCYVKLHSSGENYKVPEQTLYDQWPLTKLHNRSELQSPQFQAQFKYWAESNFRQGVMCNSTRSQLIARLEKDHSALSPPQLRFAIAVIHFYSKDYDQAIAEADRCASGNMLLYSNLLTCHCHLMKRALPQALADLNRLTALFPDSQLVLDTVDLYYYLAETRQSSIKQMKTLLLKNTKNEAALVELAKIYRDLSQQEESLKYCDLALQLRAKDANLLLMRASILTSQQNYAAALKSLSTILALDHENGAAYFARAAIYTQQSRWSDAVSDLTQAARVRYDQSRSYRARAACYGALKKFDLARQDLRIVKVLDNTANMGSVERFPNH